MTQKFKKRVKREATNVDGGELLGSAETNSCNGGEAVYQGYLTFNLITDFSSLKFLQQQQPQPYVTLDFARALLLVNNKRVQDAYN